MSDPGRTALAVLGSPISHSQSPTIHRAAYSVLGLDWSYHAVEITGAMLEKFVRSRDSTWRGLSLTMPLKRDILPLLARRHPLVDVVGAANSVLITGDGLLGFNTDVYGVTRSLRDAGVESLQNVHVLGAGATAASVIAGVVELGATRVLVSARAPEKATPLAELGAALGVNVMVAGWGLGDDSLMSIPDAVISTLPGGHDGLPFTECARSQAVLFDVAYDPWPSTLATRWVEVGGTVISGLDLLVNQAIAQIRVFVNGQPDFPLPDEELVVAAMWRAVDSAP
ncbi:MAG: shikimate dehydrogenase family protein [Rhodoglobus sp.]